MTYKLHKDFIVAVSKYASTDVVDAVLFWGISLNRLAKISLHIA